MISYNFYGIIYLLNKDLKMTLPTYDEWEHSVFKNVSYFVVLKMFGGGKKERTEFKDLNDAIKAADCVIDEYGRRPILYAVSKDDHWIVLDRNKRKNHPEDKNWFDWLKIWEEQNKE